ncbi:V-type ATP synthase subunit I [Tetragenococcus muriaticus]|uniref:V-type ATP synthase subunit I n=2 Tax=Tetragenococcus TaxID=51668 RepID=A0A091C7E1_9ENTE|nr:V-type ATP synthase subunit I [Tetragenococcus muriaticus]KFN92814.1 V-type ATP synthase subunit I [Tetragenococcus muriaticus 3MR10-3]
MAIEKMQKFHLITFYGKRDTVMEQLQDFQQIELFSAENYHKKTDSFFSQMQEHPEADKIENQVGNVSWALSFLEQYIEKPGMVQALRKPLRHYTLRQLSEHANTFDWQNVYSDLRQQDKRLRTIEQKRQELSLKEDELNKWQYFDENPAILSTFNETIGLLGTVPNTELNHLKEEMRKLQHTYLEIIHQTSTTSYLLLLFLKEKSEEAHDILNEAGFQEYEYPYEDKPAQVLKQTKEQLQQLASEEKSIKTRLKTQKNNYENLGLVAEYLDGLLMRVNANKYLLQSNYTMELTGWIPAKQTEQLDQQIRQVAGKDYFLEFTEVKEEEYSQTPVLLKNHKLIKPFEGLVEMYSLPQYWELDPTPFMTPFYALAFGLMVADFGYGLLLFVASALAKYLLNFKPAMKQNINMFQICSVPTMMWGLIYGNIFGRQFSFQLLSTDSDITEILVMSMIFGFIQIMFGLGLKFYLLWQKERAKLKALLQAGAWMFFLISVAMIAAGMVLVPDTSLQTIGIVCLIASLVMIVIGGSLDGQTVIGKIGSGLYSIMNITNYLSDLISYTRLMALGVAGGSIGAAFNLILSYLPIPAKFTIGIVLFIGLHGLNIFLSHLSAYVHGIRLQYLEFFNKFYTGGGRVFKPFKSSEAYVQVISERKQEQEDK